jgi:DNA-binding response OmpR family regulator
MAMGENIKILLIEDNLGDAYLIEDHLEEFANFSYEFKKVATLKEGLGILKKKPFDVIMLDLELPDSFGINTFLSIHNKNPLIPIIILTELHDETIRSHALKQGAHNFLIKGQTEGRLLKCIIQCSIENKKRLSSII